jgi:hypothetical protein
VTNLDDYLSTFFPPRDGAKLCRVVGVGQQEVESSFFTFCVVRLQLGTELVDRGFAFRVDIIGNAGQLNLKTNLYIKMLNNCS